MASALQQILEGEDRRYLGEVYRLSFVREAASDMRVPDDALASVVYVGGLINGNDRSSDNFLISGTGFLIHVLQPPGHDQREGFHLVTARHVIGDLKGLPLAVRLNTLANKADVVPIPVNIPVRTHADKSVDVATIRWFPDPEKYRWKCVKSEKFLNELGPSIIGVGDEIYSVGLFSVVEGRTRNVPLVRVGHIAMMASDDELIPTSDLGDIKAYLIEGHSMDGLSGAPVVVRPTVSIELNTDRKSHEPIRHLSGVGDFYLLGVMHGQWKIRANKKTERLNRSEILHSAISAVIPISKVLETIGPVGGQHKIIPQSMTDKTKDSGLVPTSAIRHIRKRPKGDVPIPPVTRKKFFDDLTKATKKKS